MSKLSGWMDEFEDNKGGSSRKSTKGHWMYMEGAPEPGNTYRVRFLSNPEDHNNPYRFYAHYPRIPDGKDENGRTKWKQGEFPDSASKTWSKRVCTDPYAKEEGRESNCPWCRLGFQRSPRWLSILIDRASGEVKYYEMPKSVFDGVKLWWKQNYDDFAGGPGSMEDETPDFNITLIIGGTTPKYTCLATQKSRRLTDEDLAALAAFNSEATTEEEKYSLPDLTQVIRPSYMDEDVQRACFNGKVIQPNPFQKREGGPAGTGPVETFEQDTDEDDVVASAATKPAAASSDDDDDWVDAGATSAKFGDDDAPAAAEDKPAKKTSRADW